MTRVLDSMTLEYIQTRDTDIGFLRDMLTQIQKSYASQLHYNASEDTFNQLFVWPFMDIIAPRATGGGKSISGQPALNSMTKQLKIVGLYVDDKNVYKSDGFIKLFDLKEQDVVLVETSGCFTNNQKNNCIAGDYCCASMDKCMKTNVYFLHTADEHLHLWNVSYHEEDVFALWRESSSPGCREGCVCTRFHTIHGDNQGNGGL
ncbi:unnamed protein product [Mucor fragilis]